MVLLIVAAILHLPSFLPTTFPPVPVVIIATQPIRHVFFSFLFSSDGLVSLHVLRGLFKFVTFNGSFSLVVVDCT